MKEMEQEKMKKDGNRIWGFGRSIKMGRV